MENAIKIPPRQMARISKDREGNDAETLNSQGSLNQRGGMDVPIKDQVRKSFAAVAKVRPMALGARASETGLYSRAEDVTKVRATNRRKYRLRA